ncbi:alpha/beta hydrolase [Nocardia sp. NPDC058497]|uniref:alpha/beta hydrolase n=1 Tax=Nocardia sp. NPDC058497 TaxID=3346529 RepID=UPI00366837D0
MGTDTAASAPRTTVASTALISHPEASVRSRVNYVLARLIAKPIYRVWPLSDTGIRALTLLDGAFGLVPAPATVVQSVTELGSVPIERYVPQRDADDALAGATVLYLHGGGFTFCGAGTHRRVTSRLAQLLAVPVYSVIYRQLPFAGVGTAVHDAYAAYRRLLEICPDPGRVIVAGDSSGAFLAAKICELAATDGIAMPAAYIGYSAHVNLDVDLRDHAVIGRDALMPVSAYTRAKQKWTRGPVDLRGARSLLQIDPAVFPPTFLTVAAKEMFEADILEFAQVLGDGGRDVEAHVWQQQVHAFPVLDGLLPESLQAVGLTAEFLRRVIGARSSTAA